jgi:hypothetical protein
VHVTEVIDANRCSRTNVIVDFQFLFSDSHEKEGKRNLEADSVLHETILDLLLYPGRIMVVLCGVHQERDET